MHLSYIQASSEGLEKPSQTHSLARTIAARIHNVWNQNVGSEQKSDIPANIQCQSTISPPAKCHLNCVLLSSTYMFTGILLYVIVVYAGLKSDQKVVIGCQGYVKLRSYFFFRWSLY